MKNKILLAVLILFVFTVPSCAEINNSTEITALTLCQMVEGNPYGTPLRNAPFVEMVADPNHVAWTKCADVVGLWKYGRQYLQFENTDEGKARARALINRTIEIAAFMSARPAIYNKKNKSVGSYFHYLAEINNSLCQVTKSCNGRGSYKFGENGTVVFVSKSQEAAAKTVAKFQEGGSGDDIYGSGNNGGGPKVSLMHINYFR